MANDNGITIGQLTEQLNQKVDLPTGSSQDTVDYVVEWKTPTANDPTWFRKYKSGWVEQGGFSTVSSGQYAQQTIYLIKQMQNSFYSVNAIAAYPGSGDTTLTVKVDNTNAYTDRIVLRKNWSSTTGGIYWTVKGQGA